MLNEVCEAIVKIALVKKYVLANKVVAQITESDKFFELLNEYDELFWDTHKQLSKACEPYILSDNWTDAQFGCKALEEHFDVFKKQRTPAEEKASELCLKYL